MKNEQQSRQESVSKFVPSTGKEKYIKPSSPTEPWEEVKRMWVESRNLAASAVSLFMDMGDILIPLREQTTDAKFGTLRKKYVPELSRQDAYRAMNMARNRERFRVDLDSPTPSLSVFAEMVNASDDLVKKVIEKTADPAEKTPTVKEVREEVKKEKPTSVDDFEESVIATVGDSEDVTDVDQVDLPPKKTNQEILAMSLAKRIAELGEEDLDTSSALLLIGLNPDYDGNYPCNIATWHGIIATILKTCTREEAKVVTYCAAMVDRTLWT